ncbi:MAG: hypothetical protein EZS28_028119, partial [Streblomastix strix]
MGDFIFGERSIYPTGDIIYSLNYSLFYPS